MLMWKHSPEVIVIVESAEQTLQFSSWLSFSGSRPWADWLIDVRIIIKNITDALDFHHVVPLAFRCISPRIFVPSIVLSDLT